MKRRGSLFGPQGIGSVPQPTKEPQVVKQGKRGPGIPGVPNVKRISRPTGATLTSPRENTAMKPARQKMVHPARDKNAGLKNAAARRLQKNTGRSKFSKEP